MRRLLIRALLRLPREDRLATRLLGALGWRTEIVNISNPMLLGAGFAEGDRVGFSTGERFRVTAVGSEGLTLERLP